LGQRLARRGLHAQLLHADMASFKLERPVDLAICTFNTFRCLCTERAARSCLQSVAGAVRPGGLFILGLHLLPPEAEAQCLERWSARHAGTTVTVTFRVLAVERRRRIERIRVCMLVRNGRGERRLRIELPMRLYSARQFRRLLSSVPEFELCQVYDFWYEIDDPIELDDEAGDVVVVLRRNST
jgi:SAM-dependent methyltransferase